MCTSLCVCECLCEPLSLTPLASHISHSHTAARHRSLLRCYCKCIQSTEDTGKYIFGAKITSVSVSIFLDIFLTLDRLRVDNMYYRLCVRSTLSRLSRHSSRSFSILVPPTAPIPFSHPYRALIAPFYRTLISRPSTPPLPFLSLSSPLCTERAHTRAHPPARRHLTFVSLQTI